MLSELGSLAARRPRRSRTESWNVLKDLIRSGCIVTLTLMALGAGNARAEGEYISECVQRAAQQAATAGEYTGYGTVADGFCLLGGWISTGGELQYSLNLEAGTSYLIVGAGDRDVKDLDISVSDGSSTVEDVEDDNTPFVHLAAEDTVEATITLRNHQGSSQPDFCVLIILQSQGGDGNADALVQAAQGLVKAVGGVGGGWSSDPSDWCLVGGLFGTGGEAGINRSFEAGEYALVGFGDSACKDLDASVTDDEGNPVATDEETDSTPVVPFAVEGDGVSGTLNLKMHEAKGNAFGVAIVLKKQ